MRLSIQLSQLIEEDASHEALGRWLALNEAAVISALEMDELTARIPEIKLSDIPSLIAERDRNKLASR